MRILYFIRDAYPTQRPDVVTLFGDRLPAEGIASDLVATLRKNVERAPTWPGGGAHFVVGGNHYFSRAWRTFYQDISLLKRTFSADAVVIRDRILTAVLALWLVRDRPVIYWMSFPFPEEDRLRARLSMYGGLHRLALRLRAAATHALLYRLVIPRVAHVFVQSQRMAEIVAERSGRRYGLTPVPMGVDEALLSTALAQQLPTPISDQVVLGYLGLLDRVRNIEFLLDVLAALDRRGINADLLLVGGCSNPADLEWLKARIEMSGFTKRVTMTGQLPLLDAWGLLRDTTVAVSAIPRGEVYDVSSPTKTVEYLALGIPVVVNDIPDQEDLVNETGGGICCRMEPDTFADAIAKVLEDRETYARSAVACRKRLLEQRGYDGLSQLVAAQLRRTIADYGRGKRA